MLTSFDFQEIFSEIKDEETKMNFLNDMISFISVTNQESMCEITKLKLERDHLNDKVNRAQALIEETIAEASKAQKATTNDMRNRLQITRDRLIIIASTTHIIGEHIYLNTSAENTIDALNNIIASVGIITDELVNLNLWDNEDVKPELSQISIEKTTKNKKR